MVLVIKILPALIKINYLMSISIPFEPFTCPIYLMTNKWIGRDAGGSGEALRRVRPCYKHVMDDVTAAAAKYSTVRPIDFARFVVHFRLERSRERSVMF